MPQTKRCQRCSLHRLLKLGSVSGRWHAEAPEEFPDSLRGSEDTTGDGCRSVSAGGAAEAGCGGLRHDVAGPVLGVAGDCSGAADEHDAARLVVAQYRGDSG